MSVTVSALAVAGAGAPTLVAGSSDTAAAQELVDLARLDQQAIALSHSLADERDGMVEYIAAGRGGTGVGKALRSRVDRQARELRTAAASAPTGPTALSDPAALVKALKKLPSVRKRAMTGRGGPMESYEDYSHVIRTLRQLTNDVAAGLPARAKDRTASALPDLARAIDQASATRGLLEAALAGQGTQRSLVKEAGQARVREAAALADFEENADAKARDRYSTTVNGTDVSVAERYLDHLTTRQYLPPGGRALDKERFDASVSARIAHMRGVQSSFAAAEIKRLEGLRDDDVTALQVRAGLVGFCLLLAVALSVATARSLTRPLAVLRHGSKRLANDPAGEEPITFHGRNDEFADVVRSLNTLRATAAELRRRSSCAEREQDQLAVEKAQLTEQHQLLAEDFAKLRAELAQARDQLAGAAPGALAAEVAGGSGSDAAPAEAGYGAFADLATRSLHLVDRQLGIIEGLEEKEADPARLDTLFKLDHLATRVRRHSENLLLLAGAERFERDGLPEEVPAPLLDVMRAAVSEIAQYERVELVPLPQEVRVSGSAADDLSHLVAELLDNAAAFSPAESRVRLIARTLEDGAVTVSVEDEGTGMSGEARAELNARLAEPETADASGPWGLGLYVVSRLSARHGVRVRLRSREEGGIAADVTVPHTLLLPAAPDAFDGAASTGGPGPLAGAGTQGGADDGEHRIGDTYGGAYGAAVAPGPAQDQGHALDQDGRGSPALPGVRTFDRGNEHARAADQAPGLPGRNDPSTGPFGPAQSAGSVQPTQPTQPTQLAQTESPQPLFPEGQSSEGQSSEGQSPVGQSSEGVSGEGRSPRSHLPQGRSSATRSAESAPSAAPAAPAPYASGTPGTPGISGSTTDASGASAGARGGGAADDAAGASSSSGRAGGSPEAGGSSVTGGPVTHTGLPKRVRGAASPEAGAPGETSAPRPRKGGADPEELRRRLDGFQQGARRGLRDAAAQTAAGSTGCGTGAQDGTEGGAESPGTSEGDEESAPANRTQANGGTSEEARK